MTSIISLPQETTDAIVDELANLCRNAPVRNTNLRNCSQVSRAFRSHARRLLFSTVSLDVRTKEKDPTPSKKFRNLLEGDPELGNLVYTFRLNLESVNHDPRLWAPQKILDKHLAIILTLLPNLRKLVLASADGLTGWQAFTDKVHTAMFKLHDLPSLESLELFGHNLSVPVDFVARWTRLKNLIVHVSPFELAPGDSIKLPIPEYVKKRDFAQLTTLHLIRLFASTDALFDHVGDGALLHALINLEAEMYGSGDWEYLWKIMRRNSRLLQNLAIRHLYTTCSHNNIVAAVGMDNLETPNLRSLVYEERSLRIEADDVSYIANLLASQFASGPKLEAMSINLQWIWAEADEINFFPPPEDAIVIGREDAWHKLDAKLAASPSFKRLDIHLHSIHGSQEMANRLKRQFAKAFEWWTPENAFPILSSKNGTMVRLSLSDDLTVHFDGGV